MKLILEEEYKEADGAEPFWFAGLVGTLVFAVVALAAWAEGRSPSAAVSAVALGVAALAAGALLARCRLTIRAWRDQKRAAEMAKQDPSRPAPCPNCARKQETPPWGAYRS